MALGSYRLRSCLLGLLLLAGLGLAAFWETQAGERTQVTLAAQRARALLDRLVQEIQRDPRLVANANPVGKGIASPIWQELMTRLAAEFPDASVAFVTNQSDDDPQPVPDQLYLGTRSHMSPLWLNLQATLRKTEGQWAVVSVISKHQYCKYEQRGLDDFWPAGDPIGFALMTLGFTFALLPGCWALRASRELASLERKNSRCIPQVDLPSRGDSGLLTVGIYQLRKELQSGPAGWIFLASSERGPVVILRLFRAQAWAAVRSEVALYSQLRHRALEPVLEWGEEHGLGV